MGHNVPIPLWAENRGNLRRSLPQQADISVWNWSWNEVSFQKIVCDTCAVLVLFLFANGNPWLISMYKSRYGKVGLWSLCVQWRLISACPMVKEWKSRSFFIFCIVRVPRCSMWTVKTLIWQCGTDAALKLCWPHIPYTHRWVISCCPSIVFRRLKQSYCSSKVINLKQVDSFACNLILL